MMFEKNKVFCADADVRCAGADVHVRADSRLGNVIRSAKTALATKTNKASRTILMILQRYEKIEN